MSDQFNMLDIQEDFTGAPMKVEDDLSGRLLMYRATDTHTSECKGCFKPINPGDLCVMRYTKAYGNYNSYFFHVACARAGVEKLLLELQEVLAGIDDIQGALPRLAFSQLDYHRRFAAEELGRPACNTGSSQ